jgi:hypothetical protein
MEAAQGSCCYTLQVKTPETNADLLIFALNGCHKLPYGFVRRLYVQGDFVCQTGKMHFYQSFLNGEGQEEQDAVLFVITVYVEYIASGDFDEYSSDLSGSFGDVYDYVERMTKESNIFWAKEHKDICWTKHDLDQDSGIFDPTAFIRTLGPDLAELVISTMPLII